MDEPDILRETFPITQKKAISRDVVRGGELYALFFHAQAHTHVVVTLPAGDERA
jgi:hypothetical protein